MTAAERAAAVVGQLEAAGVTITASVPDSWLSSVLDALAGSPAITHVRVTREDDGAAICAGAALAGHRGALVCQNAGLLLSINGLAGYAHHHQLPFVVLAAMRGEADDAFFYHVYKGKVTVPVLDAIGVKYHRLEHGGDDETIGRAVLQAELSRAPVVVLLSRASLLGDEA